MKYSFLIISLVIVFISIGGTLLIRHESKLSSEIISIPTEATNLSSIPEDSPEKITPKETTPNTDVIKDQYTDPKSPTIPTDSGRIFAPPLPRAAERITKKPFGIFITPTNSPVSPERFSGYHTGTDFETFPEEADTPVTVSALCSGTLKTKEWVSGYGGAVIESCTIENKPVTILYGHLKLASINHSVGESLDAGETIGILGKGYSTETDGERKHLHLSIHRDSSIVWSGYVSKKSTLSDWLDPCSLGACGK